MKSNKPILVIDDDNFDLLTTKKALKEIKVTNSVVSAQNGEEALEYLQNPDSELPCIILLDLNMPRMNGLEFLEVIKQDANLKKIPVIVMTTSLEDQDKNDSFSLGIAGYMQKPIEYATFIKTVKAINLYWTISELP